MSRLLHHLRSARGQALVEFALVLPIFAILLFGIIDFGRYVFTANSLNNGAREAARFTSVAVFPAECSGLTRTACATTIAQSHAWGVPGSSVSVTVTCEGYDNAGNLESPAPSVNGCTTGDLLRVRTQTNFTLVTPLIAQLLGSQTIRGDARVAVNP
jgi:Flp pilus assembly protein TadG